MKDSLVLSGFLLLGLFFFVQDSTNAQSGIPTVLYEQGKIIGSLPYGRHFYIEGSTLLPQGTMADEIIVRIFKVPGKRVRRKKDKPELTSEEIKSILDNSELQLNTSTWSAFRAQNKARFKTYMNATLKFKKDYLVVFSYLKVFNFKLSESEKELILNKSLEQAFTFYQKYEELDADIFGDFLNQEIRKVLTEKTANDYFYTSERIENKLPVITRTALEELNPVLLEYAIAAGMRSNISKANEDLQAVQKVIARIPAGHPDQASYQKKADNIKEQIAEDNEVLQTLEASLPVKEYKEKLKIIKNQLVVVREEYDLGQSIETSKTELNSIQIGSSFGGGAVALNNTNSNFDDLDAFGYSALKFHLSPVDKRIADPYLGSNFFLDRLSFLLGFSTKKNFNYKGDELKQILGITPFLGMSYDISRYLSIDLGTTFFKQESPSPFINDEKIRVGPVLGINFDLDAFNRVSSMVKGESFKIDPTPN